MAAEPVLTDVNAYSPAVLEHLIGQSKVVERVRVALEAAWADGSKFPNAVLTGPPGLGKSILARLVSREMGVEPKESLAQTLKKPSQLHSLLLEAGDRDVVFVDECDELHPRMQTQLYRALEDRKLFVSWGPGHSRTKQIPLADFTFLAGTNNEFSLVTPLRDRFRLTLRFEYYSLDELTAILRQRCQALSWHVAPEVLMKIASLGRGTPRIALRMLEACRRTSRAEGSAGVTVPHFQKTCRLEGLDSLGLDQTEQRLLAILHEAQEPVPLNMLAMRLSLPRRTVTNIVEAYLIREGLVTKEDSLRKLTAKGLEHIQRSREEQ